MKIKQVLKDAQLIFEWILIMAVAVGGVLFFFFWGAIFQALGIFPENPY